MEFAELIPQGRENAIPRKQLIQKAVTNGFISVKIKDKDREMRRLIKKSRIDWTILNISNGDGYYRPTYDDLLDLRRYIQQEENRGKAVFKNIQNAKKLYEDYLAGRK